MIVRNAIGILVVAGLVMGCSGKKEKPAMSATEPGPAEQLDEGLKQAEAEINKAVDETSQALSKDATNAAVVAEEVSEALTKEGANIATAAEKAAGDLSKKRKESDIDSKLNGAAKKLNAAMGEMKKDPANK
jgi:hypothetical protein